MATAEKPSPLTPPSPEEIKSELIIDGRRIKDLLSNPGGMPGKVTVRGKWSSPVELNRAPFENRRMDIAGKLTQFGLNPGQIYEVVGIYTKPSEK